MEKKYKINLFIMAVLLVIFTSISAYLIYEKYYKSNNNEQNQSENINNNNEQNQSENINNNNEQNQSENKNNNNEQSQTENKNNNEQSQTENNYTIFAQNLKKDLSKYDNNNYNYQRVTNEIVTEGYEIFLNEKGNLYVRYFNKELNDKYGEYKIADNVLSFYVINDGQNFGNMLYFINEDGTVGKADTEYRTNDNISVIKDIGYKNIVSIISGTFGDEFTGYHGPIFIDINGKIYSEVFK